MQVSFRTLRHVYICVNTYSVFTDSIYTRIKYTVRHYMNTQKCLSLHNELIVLDRRPNLFSCLCVRVSIYITRI